VNIATLLRRAAPRTGSGKLNRPELRKMFP
jgi:hypothetical protein